MRLNKHPPEDVPVVEYLGIAETRRLSMVPMANGMGSRWLSSSGGDAGAGGPGGMLGGQLEGLPPPTMVEDEGASSATRWYQLKTSKACPGVRFCCSVGRVFVEQN